MARSCAFLTNHANVLLKVALSRLKNAIVQAVRMAYSKKRYQVDPLVASIYRRFYFYAKFVQGCRLGIGVSRHSEVGRV